MSAGPDDATVAAVIADNITAATVAGASDHAPPAPNNTPKPIGLEDGHQPDQDVFS